MLGALFGDAEVTLEIDRLIHTVRLKRVTKTIPKSLQSSLSSFSRFAEMLYCTTSMCSLQMEFRCVRPGDIVRGGSQPSPVHAQSVVSLLVGYRRYTDVGSQMSSRNFGDAQKRERPL